jgi:hypothetical protein
MQRGFNFWTSAGTTATKKRALRRCAPPRGLSSAVMLAKEEGFVGAAAADAFGLGRVFFFGTAQTEGSQPLRVTHV